MTTSRRTPKLLLALSILAVGAGAARGSFAAATKPTNGRGAQVVVRLTGADPEAMKEVAQDFGLRVVKGLLASRQIYLLEPTQGATEKGEQAKLAKSIVARLEKDGRVEWAEVNSAIDASDDRFHAWPEGDPTYVGTDPSAWLDQPVATQLALDVVHQQATGEGVTVAVLDTGVDRQHPAIADRLGGAWDYVDDDDDPTDSRNETDDDGDGAVDEAYGHGTHVSGIVALVAPAAKILPARVLDADGRGNIFVVAQAIEDVVTDGAKVVNLSFGTEDNIESKLLKDAIAHAQQRGAIVVASAGNSASTTKRFPASAHNVVAVGGESASATALASFSNRGDWVRIAAPSSSIVSALPGGGFAAWSGTSMAAPFVSAQVALLRSAADAPKSKSVIEAILMSSVKFRNGNKGDPNRVDILRSIERFVHH
jgi:subtilisin family serine protease